MSSRLRSIAVLGLVMAVVGACGDDDAGSTTTTATGSTAVTTSTGVSLAPTELRFTINALTGSQGKAVVVIVFDAAGMQVGSTCAQVDADPWSGTGVVVSAAQDNPCNHDAPFGVVISVEDDYRYLAAVFTPGDQIAGICTTGSVTLEGPTEVELAGTDFVPICNG